MAESPATILDKLPSLVAQRDAAALVALQDHDDKQVRKAVRKAIHTLRSRGVEIPAAGAARSWTAGDLRELRGDLSQAAMLDAESTPGLTRILITSPQAERNFLWSAAISGRDQVVDFAAYVQTDGQRARMVREWERTFEGRRVPADWARARIRWAREQTLTSGFSVPTQLDDMLVHLGPGPSERPASFLEGQLPQGDFQGTKDNVEAALLGARVFAWPPVIDVEPALQRVSEANPDMNNDTPEDQRYAALLAAVAGDPEIRGGLKLQVANLLDDAAISLWLQGKDDVAGQLRALAGELRTSPEPEALPWIGRLLGFQIASTLAYIQRQQAAQPRQG